MPDVLNADRLTQRYGEKSVLSNVSLAFQSGVVALVGVNGAGKSTLLRILAGAQRPSEGSVRIEGADPYQQGSRRPALSRVALMPQTNDFPGNLTAFEVVSSIAWFKGANSRTARATAKVALSRVGLTERAAVKASNLSGGMLRRVALAQALVGDPDILLLDEPSTGLDPEQRRSMVALIQGLSSSLIIFSSHVMEDIDEVADSVVILDEGIVVYNDSLANLKRLGELEDGSSSARGNSAERGFLSVLGAARGHRAES